METIRWNVEELGKRPVSRLPTILVAAFRGWNDAAEAATQAAKTLRDWSSAKALGVFDSETYFDFQAVRPEMVLRDGVIRSVAYPGISIYGGTLSDREIIVVEGPEPSLRWPMFCDELVTLADVFDASLVVTLGALLAEVPHSRPVSITGGASRELAGSFPALSGTYTGPAGIVSTVLESCQQRQLPALSIWGAVPSYAHGGPNPKVTLALLDSLQEACGLILPDESGSYTQLRVAAASWEERVNTSVAEHDQASRYVQQLEESYDDRVESAASANQGIVEAFEDYLANRPDLFGGSGGSELPGLDPTRAIFDDERPYDDGPDDDGPDDDGPVDHPEERE
jgi:hypothetical protein